MSRSKTNWLFVAGLLIVAVFYARPSPLLSRPSVDESIDFLGIIISGMGLFLRVVAREWKIVKGKEDLVTSGPYFVIRHPLYVGSFLAGLGLCIVLGSIPFLAVFVVCFIGIHLGVAKSEERFLTGHWADRYPAYIKAVPGWLPSPFRLIGWLTSGSWLSCLHKRAVARELSAICGILAGAALLDAWSDYAVEGWSAARAEALPLMAAAFLIVAMWSYCVVGLKIRTRWQ